MPSDPHVAVAQDPRAHHHDPACPQFLDPRQAVRELCVEAAVQLDRQRRGRQHGQRVAIDRRLHRDMRCRLALQVASLRIPGIIELQRPFDVDRPSVMTLDQVAVVAVHAADEVADRENRFRRKSSRQGRCLRAELEREVAQVGPGRMGLGWKQGKECWARVAHAG